MHLFATALVFNPLLGRAEANRLSYCLSIAMRFWVATVLSWVVIAVCILAIQSLVQERAGHIQQVSLCCAASLRPIVEPLSRDCLRDLGIRLNVQYGGSQSLLTALEFSESFDLFLPADSSFMDSADRMALIQQRHGLGQSRLCLVVAHDSTMSPNNLRSVLALPGINISQADPDLTAAGSIARTKLAELDLWTAWRRKVSVLRPTVTDVANDVALGAADLGVVFELVAVQNPKLRIIELPEFDDLSGTIELGILSKAKAKPETIISIVQAFRSPELGGKYLKQFGIGNRSLQLPRSD